MGIVIEQAALGSIGTNCYIIKNTDTREGVMVDTADDFDAAVSFIDRSGIKPVAILLTHGHYDHMTAAVNLSKKYDVKIYAAAAEERTLADPSVNLSAQMGRCAVSMKADYGVNDGEVLELAGAKIKAILTPGHTEGGMSYYIKGSILNFNAGFVISGDTLFEESVGRTDFPGGSMSTIVGSIKDKLFALPNDTIVLPGHGGTTTIGHEKVYNPFCQG